MIHINISRINEFILFEREKETHRTLLDSNNMTMPLCLLGVEG